ncbi:MAG TPA: hypothetical protein VN397_02305 [Candidatus Methylomirabilis sp.]|nr:hypothetical protein [Candidatus Methylomirabilis sp.]
MPHLSMSHDAVRHELNGISSLSSQVERDAVANVVIKLSDGNAWYPDTLRRELKSIQAKGTISEIDRHAVEKKFFPEHAW